MKIYKITLKNHINSANLVILISALSLFFPYAMSLIKNEGINSFIDAGVFIFCLLNIPALIIHINYYIVNRGDVLEYSLITNEITIYHNNAVNKFSLDDIDYVQRSMSWNKAAKRSFIVPWEGYNHSSIFLKNGRQFTVTSLMMPDLDLPLKKEKIIIKENFYRLAKAY